MTTAAAPKVLVLDDDELRPESRAQLATLDCPNALDHRSCRLIHGQSTVP
jgi:hypothetical protein